MTGIPGADGERDQRRAADRPHAVGGRVAVGHADTERVLPGDADGDQRHAAERDAGLHRRGERAPAITSAAATTFTVGSAGSFTVVMTGFPAPTVSVTAGTLPAGVTLSPAGALERDARPGHRRRAQRDVHRHQRHRRERRAGVHVDGQPGAGDHEREHGGVRREHRRHDVPGGDDRFPRADGERDRRRAADGPHVVVGRAAFGHADAERILPGDAHGHQRHAAERDAELHGRGQRAAGDHQRERDHVHRRHAPAPSPSRRPASRCRRCRTQPARCRRASRSRQRRRHRDAERDGDATGAFPLEFTAANGVGAPTCRALR